VKESVLSFISGTVAGGKVEPELFELEFEPDPQALKVISEANSRNAEILGKIRLFSFVPEQAIEMDAPGQTRRG
jgi:hypothetical protein